MEQAVSWYDLAACTLTVVAMVLILMRPMLPRWQRLADGHENPWEGEEQ